MRYSSIILFELSGNAFAFIFSGKLSMRHSREEVFIKLEGKYTKDSLKKLYPNTSIKISTEPHKISRFEKDSLVLIYIKESRLEKINKLLNDE